MEEVKEEKEEKQWGVIHQRMRHLIDNLPGRTQANQAKMLSINTLEKLKSTV